MIAVKYCPSESSIIDCSTSLESSKKTQNSIDNEPRKSIPIKKKKSIPISRKTSLKVLIQKFSNKKPKNPNSKSLKC